MNCKEANLKLCSNCIANERMYQIGLGKMDDCFIEHYYRNLKKVSAYNTTKDILYRIIVDCSPVCNIWLYTTVKHYYPELLDWYDKMVLLK